jgi:hypothetical protein
LISHGSVVQRELCRVEPIYTRKLTESLEDHETKSARRITTTEAENKTTNDVRHGS